MDKLAQILESRKRHVQIAKEKVSFRDLELAAKDVLPPISLASAISHSDRISLIAEMKRKSPSAGMIRPDYNVEDISKAYERGGAAALSVVTEPEMFGGEATDIVNARRASRLPILRKDFIFDPYQIVEARVRGADAILLIADMLSASQLRELFLCARQYGLETLVEAFTSNALSMAVATGSQMIGINTRDLRTLEMHPENIASMVQSIPKGRIVVAESGIKNSADLERLKSLPVSAVLVGESLLRQIDLEAATKTLVSAGIRR